MYNLLASSAGSWILIVIMVAIIVVMFVFNSRSQKKRQEETKAMLDAIQPGNKVKTIGGICGIVVEVCPEDNTFVLETGTEKSGKCCIKFDKQAVYQTDAVVKKEEPKAEVKEEVKEEPKEEVVETAPETEEVKTEEKAE